MTTQRKPRTPVTIRLSPEALEQVDALAHTEERDRSDMLRLLLKTGLAKWHTR